MDSHKQQSTGNERDQSLLLHSNGNKSLSPQAEPQHPKKEIEPPANQSQTFRSDNEPGIKRPRLSLSLKRRKKASPRELLPSTASEQEHKRLQLPASLHEGEKDAKQPVRPPSLDGTDNGHSFRHSLALMELALTNSLFPYVRKLSSRELEK